MVISNREWVRPILSPVPAWVQGIDRPVADLSGKWRWIMDPAEGFGSDYSFSLGWQEINVPCEIRRKPGLSDRYAFGKLVRAPYADGDYRYILQFQATNHKARIWIDGVQIAGHVGSYAPWECDISAHVVPGACFFLVVEIDGKPELSPYNTGGIVRPVLLTTLPELAFTRFQVKAAPDDSLERASLEVDFGINRPADAKVRLSLIDPSGRPVALEREEWPAPAGELSWEISTSIEKPGLWDGEHPRLYTLKALLIAGGEEVELVQRKIGFRSLEIKDREMLVNKRPIKLRGICRQDISPLEGRVVQPEMLEQEIRLYKQANINYIHNLYYPASEVLLDLCDRYGLYVQEDMALAFIDQLLPATQNDPAFEKAYVTAAAEIVERGRSHPSLAMWCLGSESGWGANFRKAFRYIRKEETGIPVLFHQAMTLQGEDELPDIWPVHNCAWDLDPGKCYDHMVMTMTTGAKDPPGYLNGYAEGLCLPVLHDQIAKVPCDDSETLKRDPGIHAFWGESILRIWEGIWACKGALGAAVVCGVDDVDPAGGRRYRWGILDVRRRKKPEYEMLRKAYAPVRLRLDGTGIPGEYELSIAAENRFNHTNLSEAVLNWSCGGGRGSVRGPDCEPAQVGYFVIPKRQWQEGDELLLEFTCHGSLIYEEKITFRENKNRFPVSAEIAAALELQEYPDRWVVKNDLLEYVWDKATGQLRSAAFQKERLMCGGPFLHIVGIHLAPFTLDSMSAKNEQGVVSMHIEGRYGNQMEAGFEISMDGCGRLTTRCILERVHIQMPGRVKMKAGLNCGGLHEIGVGYLLDNAADRMRFERKALWSVLGEDHPGRSKGLCFSDPLGRAGALQAAENREERPDACFGSYLYGSDDFRALRYNLYSACIGKGNAPFDVCLVSDGSGAVRLEADWSDSILDDRDPSILYAGEWYAVEDNSGSWRGTEMYSNRKGSYAEVGFLGTGIVWLGSRDMIGGYANIYLDGQFQQTVGQFTEDCDLDGISRGYEKRYGNILFAVNGLPMTRHTLRIEVTGEKEGDSHDAYVMLDAFLVLKPDQKPRIRMLALADYNYSRIAGGNYTRPPVTVSDGYEQTFCLSLQKRGKGVEA